MLQVLQTMLAATRQLTLLAGFTGGTVLETCFTGDSHTKKNTGFATRLAVLTALHARGEMAELAHQLTRLQS